MHVISTHSAEKAESRLSFQSQVALRTKRWKRIRLIFSWNARFSSYNHSANSGLFFSIAIIYFSKEIAYGNSNGSWCLTQEELRQVRMEIVSKGLSKAGPLTILEAGCLRTEPRDQLTHGDVHWVLLLRLCIENQISNGQNAGPCNPGPSFHLVSEQRKAFHLKTKRYCAERDTKYLISDSESLSLSMSPKYQSSLIKITSSALLLGR